MNRKDIKTFLIWLAILNWPPVLIHISEWFSRLPHYSMPVSFLKLLSGLPYLLWINIPALWLGLARGIGKPHYDIQEFGALPQTVLAWGLIAAFWILVAIGLTFLTAVYPGLLYRKRKKDT